MHTGLWKLRTNAPISEGHRRTTNHEEGDGGEPLRAGIISLRPRSPRLLSINISRNSFNNIYMYVIEIN